MKYEFKFQISAIQTVMIEDWLNSFFIPDLDHPSYEVRSLYYDQPRYEDRNNFRARMRWYRTNANEQWARAFAEVKYRNIFGERSKLRHWLGDDYTPTESHHLSGNLVASITGLHQFLGLNPILAFTYSRKRYLAPDKSFSLNLDSHLKLESVLSKNVNSKWQLLFSNPLPSVLELKTNDPTIFPALKNHLLNYGDQGFSKYLFFYQSIQELQ